MVYTKNQFLYSYETEALTCPANPTGLANTFSYVNTSDSSKENTEEI